MRLIFVGSGDFAVPALTALTVAGHEIAAVYSPPPRPAGRGKHLRATPVAGEARQLGLEVRRVESANDPELAAGMAGLGADIGILVAYGALLPAAVLAAPRRGFLNIHPSLLPRWRGAAPIHRAIMAGDVETGVCIIKVNERFDRGPILLCRKSPIAGDETCSTLGRHLAAMGADMMVEALAGLDQLQPVPQDAAGGSHAGKLTAAETRIDWSASAGAVSRQIRGLADRPGAWTEYGGLRLKILAATPAAGAGQPGMVLDNLLTVACGEGALRLLAIQRPGKQVAGAPEFLRGFPIAPGEVLGGGAELTGAAGR